MSKHNLLHFETFRGFIAKKETEKTTVIFKEIVKPKVLKEKNVKKDDSCTIC